ncbi:MAG TPA: hypothetical protein PLT87_01750 [Spirochaetales bacterium]|nr:hypothetical protein [Spirochaetales bacterium]
MNSNKRYLKVWMTGFLLMLGVVVLSSKVEADGAQPYRLFPALFTKASLLQMPQTVERQPQPGQRLFTSDRIPLLANNTVVAFYGHPSSKQMGILGLYPKEEIARMVKDYARQYDAVNGPDGAIPAFYIIYGTCWPKGEIGYLDDTVLKQYIEYAQSQGMIVFVDHQIGKYSVRESMERILPFLQYPNVHLAIDPEWRTLNPMKEIGSITAAELNEAQQVMQDYIIQHNIPGIRMLVVHQFHQKMITERQTVRATFDRVLLVHTADGFGSPALKRNTYAMNSEATNMPVKGFKLFFKSDFPLAGYDSPLLSPAEVMGLDPRPSLIIYQ